MDPLSPRRIGRRAAVKWMLTASASVALLRDGLGQDPHRTGSTQSHPAPSAPAFAARAPTGTGYGTDPNLLKDYGPGDLWELTLHEEQRKTVTALCDIIIPADEQSPSASAVGVPDFIDEWISAPYAGHDKDRQVILEGLAWIDAEAGRRFGKRFHELGADQATALCDLICFEPRAAPEYVPAAAFFSLFRNLTAGGFYTTPEGMRDLQYVGNVPIPEFPEPPEDALRKLGLA